METLFRAGIAVFVASAAVFYYLGNIDGVFISLVFACLSFFISVRFQVKGRLSERDLEREAELNAEIDAASEIELAVPVEQEGTGTEN